jgi:hypothetical protein
MGPYIRYPANQSYYKKLSWEKEMMFEIIEKLPKYDYFQQNFDYKYTNWLPFYWNGFKQTTRYTYVIERNQDLESVYKNFHNDVKRRIKNAQERLRVIESEDISTFYEINKMTFERKNSKIPYSYELVEKIYESSKKTIALSYYLLWIIMR